jgi:hypothetical protein
MSAFATKSVQKSSNVFNCELCDYNTSRHSQYTRHLETEKHLKRINATKLNDLITKRALSKFCCDICSKTYKERTGLWRHKKTCVAAPEPDPPLASGYIKDNMIELLISENKDFKNIILELVKSNSDLQKQMFDVCKNSNTTINNGTMNNNHHNKTFNMQFFLNEQCKDAMNIKDFVNSMTLELEDLEEVGKLGYVEGISNIMIRKLNALDVYKRPIHCSDAKREIMFVKDDNIWAKENSTYDKLRKAIKSVTYKNSALLGPWSEKYPNCLNNQHHLNDVYVQMLGQAMGGKESFLDSENKIMKKIAKAVLIEKN